MKCVKEGYQVTFLPCKLTDTPKNSDFLIPKKDPNEDGVDYYYYFHEYIKAINTSIAPSENQTFWWRGNNVKGKSFYSNQKLGIHEMYRVPKYMASVSVSSRFLTLLNRILIDSGSIKF